MKIHKIRFLNKITNLDITINCPEDKFILDAAEESNIDLPYSCRSGSCSACVAKIKEGLIDQSNQIFLDEEQLKKNFALICIAYPLADSIFLTHQEENLY